MSLSLSAYMVMIGLSKSTIDPQMVDIDSSDTYTGRILDT
uniref:Uncharacterized protein n=1 Tax=Arundo donax TaxID=35708 RepID=A0A0A9A8X4_ARUDO